MSREHTPTPWRTIPQVRTGIFAPDGVGTKIAATKGGHVFHKIDEDLARANAAFIVLAVNAHEPMRDALIAALGALRSSAGPEERHNAERDAKAVLDSLEPRP